jgi:hypothetical protein
MQEIHYNAVSAKTGEQLYYVMDNEYKTLFIVRNTTKTYYLDNDGKTKITVDYWNDPNIVSESKIGKAA